MPSSLDKSKILATFLKLFDTVVELLDQKASRFILLMQAKSPLSDKLLESGILPLNFRKMCLSRSKSVIR